VGGFPQKRGPRFLGGGKKTGKNTRGPAPFFSGRKQKKKKKLLGGARGPVPKGGGGGEGVFFRGAMGGGGPRGGPLDLKFQAFKGRGGGALGGKKPGGPQSTFAPGRTFLGHFFGGGGGGRGALLVGTKKGSVFLRGPPGVKISGNCIFPFFSLFVWAH